MILKSYEINKINQNNCHLILFYGKNEGLKNEALDYLIKK
jgi:DNA polymerase-3 subunit delta